MNWEPTEQEIQDKLIEMAYTWGDIEEQLEQTEENEAVANASWVSGAFRVEATFDHNDFGDPCVFYELLFDVTDASARESARDLGQYGNMTDKLIAEKARPWHSRHFMRIRTVPTTTPISGQICRRVGEAHPRQVTPTLDDVPTTVSEGAVELVKRDVYLLTPIEALFYDALRETGLTFAVQPWIQGTDRKYRLDFLVFHDGQTVAVELDGHEWHKTKDQRGHDAGRDRWFAARKIQTIRWTGSQVFGDPQGCVSELLNVLRAAPSKV